ncbi:Cu-processing system permease protein [Colwellia chukchiensis]|uniref:Cu-processing system permease protein n=1 Tax=Colwellia chukchiensis TaxID=641665 RepID=A0A1H7LM36_9GAMM|nr:ABC transporter permease subunit [Colwellia chukchiensis]SEK99515.1 Cu-processing system permease protein [Colwellia chukchiensis]
MREILTVANKEFHDGLRNRWLLSITLIFAVLSVGLTYFGAAASGSVGITSLSTTIASLASLAVFLIPLIALLLSYDSFVGEQEGGTLLLLLTYPLSKNQLLLGKFFGQGGIIALATFLGFGASALLLFVQHYQISILQTFAYFIVSATLLGLSFTAIAYIISLSANEKSKAAGAALITWFFFALVFDLALLALLVGTESSLNQNTLTQLMMLNPADIFRLVNLAGLDSSDVNGALAVAINAKLSQAQLIAILLSWVLAPLVIASIIFKRKKL